MTTFPDLPDNSRIWIFTADRPLAIQERAAMIARIGEFVSDWESHARPITAEADFADDRFLLIAGHLTPEVNAGISGCAIDAMTAEVMALAEQFGFEWLGGLDVVYRDDTGTVRAVSRTAFREEVRRGRVTGDTLVVDTTISNLAALRERGLEVPASQSWHARAFRLAETAS